MPPESSKDRLPFEPRKTKKKTPKTAPISSTVTAEKKETKEKRSVNRQDSGDLSAIPDAVSKRMIRRMALFSGIPTALGISSFVVSYYVVINEIVELPTIAVLLVSLGFFGLGVIGLSYGILSTSWDEDRVGSIVGGEEFALNLGRMVQAWKANKKEARSKS